MLPDISAISFHIQAFFLQGLVFQIKSQKLQTHEVKTLKGLEFE